VLKKYHLELAGEFGNYDKEKFKQAGKTVSYFLEKIGYELREKTVKDGVSFYEIFVNDDIDRYASNRKALDRF
jgi:serine kinase of HPr protein (carbohydrate metabolism regulator)